MSPEKQREIASRGGKAAQASGRAHRFTEGEEAREAGRLGGLASAENKEDMKERGRMGGNAKKNGRARGNREPSAGT